MGETNDWTVFRDSYNGKKINKRNLQQNDLGTNLIELIKKAKDKFNEIEETSYE